jgi:hypothetical protein
MFQAAAWERLIKDDGKRESQISTKNLTSSDRGEYAVPPYLLAGIGRNLGSIDARYPVARSSWSDWTVHKRHGSVSIGLTFLVYSSAGNLHHLKSLCRKARKWQS